MIPLWADTNTPRRQSEFHPLMLASHSGADQIRRLTVELTPRGPPLNLDLSRLGPFLFSAPPLRPPPKLSEPDLPPSQTQPSLLRALRLMRCSLASVERRLL